MNHYYCLGIEDVSAALNMKHANESATTLETEHDIAARRIKNRDRQRRYRARKRLEADSKKKKKKKANDHAMNNSITRKCTRDWKTEARMAHRGSSSSRLVSIAEEQARLSSSLNVDDGERIVASGGRHWKEEARRSVINQREQN